MENNFFDINDLNRLIKDKYVSVQKHSQAELFIYNYTPKTQYESFWNDITLQCRGLILNMEMQVVARPFRKFFNLGEHKQEDIPNIGFDVYEKMDGSLGILYWLGDKPQIATRGSFESDQAIRANKILHSKYSHVFDLLEKGKSYLFEIVYPENRIVCDYGETEDLFLLAVIDNETGEDHQLPDIGFPIVKKHDWVKDMSDILCENSTDREGYVIRFRNGFRVKVKFQEYCRLHRILTQVSNKTIWEYLSQGRDFDELLDQVPDEFYNWVKQTKSNLENEFNSIEEESNILFHRFFSWGVGETRAEFAEYAKKQKYPAILFRMLDGKSHDELIWRIVRPEFQKPFSNPKE